MTNAQSQENLKVVIDNNGNPMISPSTGAQQSQKKKRKSRGASGPGAAPDAAQTDYDTNQSAHPALGINNSSSQGSSLPAIGAEKGGQGGDQMKYTMSNFMENNEQD